MVLDFGMMLETTEGLDAAKRQALIVSACSRTLVQKGARLDAGKLMR